MILLSRIKYILIKNNFWLSQQEQRLKFFYKISRFKDK